MAKRFTDTSIWDDQWFRKLPCKYKELWRYLYERCNHAGIWKKDIEMAGFLIGEEVTEEEALDLFNTDEKDRVLLIKEDKWFIPQFISFQYVDLKQTNKIHKSIIEILKKEGIYEYLTEYLSKRKTGVSKGFLRVGKGSCKGSETLKEKEKAKDKEKDKVSVKDTDKFKEQEEEQEKDPYLSRIHGFFLSIDKDWVINLRSTYPHIDVEEELKNTNE